MSKTFYILQTNFRTNIQKAYHDGHTDIMVHIYR